MSQDKTPTSAVSTPSRRTVTRAAAWTVPVVVVAAAAPAYAASCAKKRVTVANVTSYARTSSTAWTATFDPDGRGVLPTIGLNVKASYDKGMSVRNDAGTTAGGPNDNFTIEGQVGGLGTYGLVLAQRPTENTPVAPLNAFGHYKFSFTRSVYNLTFTLTDIDSATGDFLDSVVLSSGFTYAPLLASMKGVGTSTNPFRPASTNAPIDNTNSNAGNVTITYAGPISDFTVDYNNAAASFATGVDQDQVVTISNFAFDFQPC